MTGGAFSERASAFLDGEDVVVLAKPIEPSRLMEVVAELAVGTAEERRPAPGNP